MIPMIQKKSNTIPCFWTVWAAGRAHVKSNLRSVQHGDMTCKRIMHHQVFYLQYKQYQQ